MALLQTYQPTQISIDDELIEDAVRHLKVALEYMETVETNVPQWRKQTELDKLGMRTTLESLRAVLAGT